MNKCPKCKISWVSDENIYDYFLRSGRPKEEASRMAELYGCTKDNPQYFGQSVVGFEDPEIYDGVSYWQCLNCNAVFNRFTGEETEIKDDYIPKR